MAFLKQKIFKSRVLLKTMKKRFYLVISLILISLFAISYVSAIGEWSQLQKDAEMSAYQILAGSLNNYNFSNMINSSTPTLEPIISDLNGARKVLIVRNTELSIYNSNLVLENTYNISREIYAMTTYDFDNDGNNEIIMIINNESSSPDYSSNGDPAIAGSINFTVLEYPSLTISKEISIDLPITLSWDTGCLGSCANFDITRKIGNIACGDFIGPNDCIFMSPLNYTQRFIYAFNSSAITQDDNLLKDLRISDYFNGIIKTGCEPDHNATAWSSGKIYFSLADINDDFSNEINFVWSNYFTPESLNCSLSGNLSKFFSIDNNGNVIKDFQIYHNSASSVSLFNSGIDNTITKIDDGNILLAENHRKCTSSAYCTVSDASLFEILDNSGNLKYLAEYSMPTPPSQASSSHKIDFIVYNNKVYVYSNKQNGYIQQLSVIDGYGSSVNSYFNNKTELFNGFIKATDFDNDGVLEFITPYGVANINTTLTQYIDFNLLDSADNMRYSIPTDINKDYNIEMLFINSSKMATVSGEPFTNTNTITNLFWSTGTPLCLGSSIDYSVNYTDPESNSIYLRTDCFGNGSYITSSLSFNPVGLCNYSVLGNYNAEICIKDIYHSSYDSCKTHYISVAYTNCYNTGENAGNESYINAGIGVSNDFGFYTQNFSNHNAGSIGYNSAIFDYSKCENYTVLYGFCPVIIWIKGIGTATYNWIFSFFWLFLILILILVVIAILRKNYIKG